MGTVARGIQSPPGYNGTFITVRAMEVGYDELPLAHDEMRVAHHPDRPLSGLRLNELPAGEPFQKFPVTLTHAEHALPKPQLMPASRVCRGQQEFLQFSLLDNPFSKPLGGELPSSQIVSSFMEHPVALMRAGYCVGQRVVRAHEDWNIWTVPVENAPGFSESGKDHSNKQR